MVASHDLMGQFPHSLGYGVLHVTCGSRFFCTMFLFLFLRARFVRKFSETDALTK